MIKKIKGYTVKFTAGMVLAATLISTASMAASASGLQVQAKGSVVATQQVASVTASDVASVAGNDVVSVSANNVVRVGAGKTDDAVVDGQGNMNSSQYAVDSVVDENADWHEGDGDMNPFHIYYQKARDMVANKNRMDEIRKADEEARKARQEKEAEESRRAEQYKKAEEAKLEEYAKKVHEDRIAAEGQGDVIDDQFAYVEGHGDVIDDQFAVATDETVNAADNNTEATAPSVNSFVAVATADTSVKVNDNAQSKTDDAKKTEDDVVVVFDPFNPIIPFKGVPTDNKSENKSDVLEKVKTVNKFINPSDSVYGEPVRKLIDKCDVLGNDEKDYLKTCATLAIGSAEGFATGDYLPLWGAVKKVGKFSESLVKLHDSKTKTEVVANTLDVVTNTVEGVISAIPGGGLALNAYKSQMAFGSYCFKKVCKFVNWLF